MSVNYENKVVKLTANDVDNVRCTLKQQAALVAEITNAINCEYRDAINGKWDAEDLEVVGAHIDKLVQALCYVSDPQKTKQLLVSSDSDYIYNSAYDLCEQV